MGAAILNFLQSFGDISYVQITYNGQLITCKIHVQCHMYNGQLIIHKMYYQTVLCTDNVLSTP